MKKRILITGITGTLGTCLTELLLADCHNEIIGISRDEQKQRSFPFKSKVTLRLGDVRDIDSLFYAAPEGVDEIYHLAALKCVDTLQDNPVESLKTNVNGTLNVVNVARSFGAKLLFTSTDKAVYPINAYGKSKA